MARARDWTRQRQRQQMHQHGSEGVNGDCNFLLSLPPRRPRPPQLSKAALRRQGERALAEWTAKQKPK
jgi:hypothetical protein